MMVFSCRHIQSALLKKGYCRSGRVTICRPCSGREEDGVDTFPKHPFNGRNNGDNGSNNRVGEWKEGCKEGFSDFDFNF